MKDRVVQWRGGGYDGCIWEPNTGYFNAGGEWNPVISTGSGKRDSLEEFERKRSKDDCVFEITKDGLLDFQGHIRADFFHHTITVLEQQGYDVFWRCSECNTVLAGTEGFSQFAGYRGDGGIGVINENPICGDCAEQGTCPACREYVGEDDLGEQHGICFDCFQLAARERIGLAGWLEDVPRVVGQANRMIALKPQHRASHERQRDQQVGVLNKRIGEAISKWLEVQV